VAWAKERPRREAGAALKEDQIKTHVVVVAVVAVAVAQKE
jgi:hypothetical protein